MKKDKTVPVRSTREIEVKGKTEKKTVWQGQRENWKEEGKRNDRFAGASETSEELAEWRRLQRKN